MKSIAFVSTLALLGCGPSGHMGDLDGPCNKDGSCNGPNLTCERNGMNDSVCFAKTDSPKCRSEADCFCLGCEQRCPNGVAKCEFSDTTVWGNKRPSTCECK